jgi:O-antigen ligase
MQEIILFSLFIALPLLNSKIKVIKIISIISIALYAFSICFCVRRTGVICLIVSLLVWFILQPRKKKRDYFIGLAVAIPFIVLFSNQYILRWQMDFKYSSGLGESRPEILTAAFNKFMEHFWVGAGPSNTLVLVFPKTNSYRSIHNFFLMVGTSIGLIGLILIMIPFIVTIVVTIINLRASKFKSSYARASLCMIISFFLFNSVEPSFTSSRYPIFCFIFALFLWYNLNELKVPKLPTSDEQATDVKLLLEGSK